MLTITMSSERETYLIAFGDHHDIVDCGQFHPPHYYPVAIGDVTPPCSVFNIDWAQVREPPQRRTLKTNPNSVEFLTTSGHAIRAEW